MGSQCNEVRSGEILVGTPLKLCMRGVSHNTPGPECLISPCFLLLLWIISVQLTPSHENCTWVSQAGKLWCQSILPVIFLLSCLPGYHVLSTCCLVFILLFPVLFPQLRGWGGGILAVRSDTRSRTLAPSDHTDPVPPPPAVSGAHHELESVQQHPHRCIPHHLEHRL